MGKIVICSPYDIWSCWPIRIFLIINKWIFICFLSLFKRRTNIQIFPNSDWLRIAQLHGDSFPNLNKPQHYLAFWASDLTVLISGSWHVWVEGTRQHWMIESSLCGLANACDQQALTNYELCVSTSVLINSLSALRARNVLSLAYIPFTGPQGKHSNIFRHI